MSSKPFLSLLLAAIATGSFAPTTASAIGAHWQSVEHGLTAGETAEVVCRATWPLDESVSGVLPVEPPSLDWGALKLVRVESGFEGATIYCDQVFTLTPGAPGTFRLPSIEVAYVETGAPNGESIPTVSAVAEEVEVRESSRAFNTAALAAAGTAVLATVVIMLWVRKQRGITRHDDRKTSTNTGAAREAFNNAKARRIDGDFYGCYRALSDSVTHLGGHNTLAEELAARAEQAGYGGARPDDASLDSDFRAVQRALDQASNEFEPDMSTSKPEDGES